MQRTARGGRSRSRARATGTGHQLPRWLGARRVVRDDPAGLREREVAADGRHVRGGHGVAQQQAGTAAGTSCLLLALPGADEQRPQHRPVRERGGVAVDRGQHRGGIGSGGDAVREGGRQQGAEGPSRMARPVASGSRRPATSVPSGTPAPALANSSGSRVPVHASAPAAPNAPVKYRRTATPQRVGGRADGAQVIVLHQQVPAGSDGIPQPGQHGDPLGQMEQQQPGVHEVERATGIGSAAVRSRATTAHWPCPAARSIACVMAPSSGSASMPRTRPAGPTRSAIARIVSPGPQPASRQLAPGCRPTLSSSRPVATSQPRACIRSRSYSAGVRPSE